jgi:hypothetical protein
MCGQGEYITPKGIQYTGTFKDNLLFEGICTYINESGSYVITYRSNSAETAEITFTDGSRYSGQTNGSYLNGTGQLQFPNGDNYSGKFENGQRQGYGIYSWNTMETYEGYWLRDEMSGTGKYTYSDGSIATGTFQSNKLINGTYIISNTFGEYTFQVDNESIISVDMILTNGTRCIGEMSEGKLTGFAQISYNNGDQYSGMIVEGLKNGVGTYTWSSGASYEGDWASDKMHGRGCYYYPPTGAGYKLIGNFEKGVPEGECQYYVSQTESYKTDWEAGECVKIYE